MKTKKRKRVSRMRGSHTHGRGFKKKARGSGNRGGVGMAGTGKRADQKKTLVLNKFGKNYFGKDKVLRRKAKRKLRIINLKEISERWQKDQKEINLDGYKVLSEGELKEKISIRASAASRSAIDKVKKAGGDIILKK